MRIVNHSPSRKGRLERLVPTVRRCLVSASHRM
jgi:hypothetical protein